MDEVIIAPKSMIHGDEMILLNRPYIDSFVSQKNKIAFIEVGSQRGTGSTSRLSVYAQELKMHFITVDADADNASGAAEIVHRVNPAFEAHHALGEVFLDGYNGDSIAICYLDAFDLVTDWPHKESTINSYKIRNAELSNQAAYDMHLKASKSIVDKVISGGFVCFDDVWKDRSGNWQGKGKTAIPYLLDNGYKIICYVQNSLLMQRVDGLQEDEMQKVGRYRAPGKIGLLYLKRRLASFFS
ncbi:MAG: hypothetical protein IAE67_02170 [Candidatus Competibacteraceae bacterium]|nr:hypothetical protein [Candidatus Competibacteraceae bacterium]